MRELAPAKVNLFLAVGPRRSDGYHEILTVFESIPLFDEVIVSIGPGGADCAGQCPARLVPRYRVEAEWAEDAAMAGHMAEGKQRPGETGLGPGRADAGASPPIPRDLDNLAGRAARAFVDGVKATRQGPAPDITILIRKRIPMAAGLGGGSSDAAAVLRALSRHYGIPPDDPEVEELAAGLGSDVPFFIRGGRAVGRARGEVVTPVPLRVSGSRDSWSRMGPPAAGLPLIVGLPAFPLSTRDVYAEFDRLGGLGAAGRAGAAMAGGAAGRAEGTAAGRAEGSVRRSWDTREEELEALLGALTSRRRGSAAAAETGGRVDSSAPDADLVSIARLLRNDLGLAAVSLRPEVGDALGALIEAGCLAALVSGSGPTVFGLAPRAGGQEYLDALAARASACQARAYRFIGLESGTPAAP